MEFKISGALARFTDYRTVVQIDADTVDHALRELVGHYPDLKPALFDASGGLRRTHALFLNGENLKGDRLSERVGDDDRVDILTAIAGGADR